MLTFENISIYLPYKVKCILKEDKKQIKREIIGIVKFNSDSDDFSVHTNSMSILNDEILLCLKEIKSDFIKKDLENLTFDKIKYLASMHYDIFNLIEQGLAIKI